MSFHRFHPYYHPFQSNSAKNRNNNNEYDDGYNNKRGGGIKIGNVENGKNSNINVGFSNNNVNNNYINTNNNKCMLYSTKHTTENVSKLKNSKLK